MQYIWISYQNNDVDDPSDSYIELDDRRLERRRVDLYQNGMRFVYGGEMGRTEVLSRDPYPENPTTLNRPGEVDVRFIDRSAFEDLWYRSQEWPTGFMELLN